MCCIVLLSIMQTLVIYCIVIRTLLVISLKDHTFVIYAIAGILMLVRCYLIVICFLYLRHCLLGTDLFTLILITNNCRTLLSLFVLISISSQNRLVSTLLFVIYFTLLFYFHFSLSLYIALCLYCDE